MKACELALARETAKQNADEIRQEERAAIAAKVEGTVHKLPATVSEPGGNVRSSKVKLVAAVVAIDRS